MMLSWTKSKESIETFKLASKVPAKIGRPMLNLRKKTKNVHVKGMGKDRVNAPSEQKALKTFTSDFQAKKKTIKNNWEFHVGGTCPIKCIQSLQSLGP